MPPVEVAFKVTAFASKASVITTLSLSSAIEKSVSMFSRPVAPNSVYVRVEQLESSVGSVISKYFLKSDVF